jgi:hypothetical protein
MSLKHEVANGHEKSEIVGVKHLPGRTSFPPGGLWQLLDPQVSSDLTSASGEAFAGEADFYARMVMANAIAPSAPPQPVIV